MTDEPGNTGHLQWGCSGLSGRSTRSYPLRPPGQQVERTFDFPSCWDGHRLDSPDHRSHLVFPGPGGTCPPGTVATPQLRLRAAYIVPPGRSYSVDAMPGERHSPLSDHADFINVMPDGLMAQIVRCVNSDRRC